MEEIYIGNDPPFALGIGMAIKIKNNWQEWYKELLKSNKYLLIFNNHDFVPEKEELNLLSNYGHKIIILPTSHILLDINWRNNVHNFKYNGV